LKEVYATAFLDAFYLQVRKENGIINKAAHTVTGINMAAFEDALGIWISEAESTAFWVDVLNYLRAR